MTVHDDTRLHLKAHGIGEPGQIAVQDGVLVAKLAYARIIVRHERNVGRLYWRLYLHVRQHERHFPRHHALLPVLSQL